MTVGLPVGVASSRSKAKSSLVARPIEATLRGSMLVMRESIWGDAHRVRDARVRGAVLTTSQHGPPMADPPSLGHGGAVEIRSPLVLCGPPAVGKSVTGRSLALSRPRCALIDVDDVRHLILSGAAAPWEGEEGLRQQRLGVLNACAVAANFLRSGVEVVVADVLTPDTVTLYRNHLPGCVVVRLTVSLTEALRRASSRRVWPAQEAGRGRARPPPGRSRTGGRRAGPRPPGGSGRAGLGWVPHRPQFSIELRRRQ